MNSILESIKKLLGFTPEQTDFDTDILIHINSTFSRLNRLGVGPAEGFSINDEYSLWEDFLGEDDRLNDVITYMYYKVKLAFDPPLSATVIKSMENSIKELEWDFTVTAESKPINIEEG